MTKRLAGIFLVCLLATQTAVRAQEPEPPPRPAPDYTPENWEEFKFHDGGFRVRFPGPPKEETEIKPGNLVLHALTYGSESFIFLQCQLSRPS